jgi:hypothetical protein
MENIKIDNLDDDLYNPQIDFDAETGICNISGESYLEETSKFYGPLLEWIEEYYQSYEKPLTLNFKLSYYNTNTSKKILDLFQVIKDNKKSENTVINWLYEENDIDAVEDIEDFMQITGLKINLIPYKIA